MPKNSDPATKMIEAIREGLPPGVELDERDEVGTKAEHVSAPGTEMERHPDRETVELYEAVTAALAG
jgi:hypothetical protein